MPYREELKKLNKEKGFDKTGFEMNEGLIWNYMQSIGRNRSPEVGDGLIVDYMTKRYIEEARRYEKYRQEIFIRAKAKPGDTKLQATADSLRDDTAFLERYVETVSVMVQVAAINNKKTYKHLPYFGLKKNELKDLIEQQVKGYSYREGRKYEIFDTYGVKDNRFINEVNGLDEAVNNKVTYQNASAETKALACKTYVTKKLMEEKLKSRFFLVNLLFFRETRAMNAYIAKADETLRGLNFPTDENQINALPELRALNENGYAVSDPAAKAAFDEMIEEKGNRVEKLWESPLVERNLKIEEKKAEKEQKRLAKQEEKKQKDAELKLKSDAETAKFRKEVVDPTQAESDKINEMSIEDALLQPKFRPSLDPEKYREQRAVWDKMKANIHGNVPYGVKQIFIANTEKLRRAKNFVNALDTMSDEERVAAENKVIVSYYDTEIALKDQIGENFETISYQDVENINLQDQLKKELDNKKKEEIVPKNDEKDQVKELDQKSLD